MTARDPARLAAQVHALHATAVFLADAAAAGLRVTVSGEAFITLRVPGVHGDQAARAAAVAALTAAAGGGHVVRFISPGCTGRYGIAGYGWLAGHPVTVTTPNAQARW